MIKTDTSEKRKKLEEVQVHLIVIKVSCLYKSFLALFGYSFPPLFWQVKRARLYLSSLSSELLCHFIAGASGESKRDTGKLRDEARSKASSFLPLLLW